MFSAEGAPQPEQWSLLRAVEAHAFRRGKEDGGSSRQRALFFLPTVYQLWDVAK